MKKTIAAIVFSVGLCSAAVAHADTFGSDPNTTFDIEFVIIGNPGNAADTTGDPNQAGAVAYNYRIGKFEISEDMIDKANAETAATADPLNITHDGRGANKPATSISWFEAARFINWLNTSTGSTPAYKFDGGGNFQLWDPNDGGYNPNNLYRNRLAKYVLPSVDEWYKAAYYDPNSGVYFNYPTGSDTAPTPVANGTAAGTAVYDGQSGPADITMAGGLSPYGTMGQGGNVWELEETDLDLVNDSTSSEHGVRGGSWVNLTAFWLDASNRNSTDPAIESDVHGFRVISIPEPSTLLLGALAGVALLAQRKMKR